MPSQQQRSEDDTGAARRGPPPLACEMFQGINTATTRSGVPDQMMFWCDGFIPLAPRNLRAIPGIGSAIYTNPGVSCFYFYNIGSTPYMVVFNADGSVVQVNTVTKATKVILSAGSIVNPSVPNVGIAQYGSQYLIIVANQPNGYWVWNGNALFGPGTLAPTITITNPGSGYVSAPSVQFSGGSGSGAAASATVAGGAVTNATVTNPGSGYKVGDVVTVSFVGGQQTGSGASLTAVLSAIPGGSGALVTANFVVVSAFPTITTWQVTSVTINLGGSGYSSLVTGTWNNPPSRGNPSDNQWVGAAGQPAITVNETGGAVTAVTTANQGASSPGLNISCWNTLTGSPQFPTITISDPGAAQFQVTSVTGTPTGTNYSPSTKIVASGGGSPVTQATITPIITGGVITGVNIINGGVYGSNTPPTLTANDTKTTATATVSLMPFGVQGTCVETYAGHVWVANGATVTFTAPGSVSDFATSDGGGQFVSTDSFLRVGYTRLIQTNGFLFLIGDSSMNYISGVQTNTPMGGNPTTTFTNNNSDPETGTPYPASVTTIGQDIFIANQNGIYVSTGGTFEKKSEALDGIYNSAPGIFAGVQLAAAKQLIFGKLIWMVLVPIIDPVTKTQRNKLFMFNQRYWWSSEQDVTLSFIQSQEINSVFQAYGTDGTNIYPLFNKPSTAFTKRFQTRLWDTPSGYDHVKSSVNVFAMAQFVGNTNSYNIYIDNEKGITQRAGPYAHNGVGNSDQEVTSIMPPTAVGQNGVLTGMTVETTADDLVIVSVMMQPEIVGYRA